ncbi:MAG: TAXI family TRAP transporter solute-binding subunit [Caldisericia bacterium]|nr:TAXI family TRAP transporter solute-binding subunit [Caldisericia bacterium]
MYLSKKLIIFLVLLVITISFSFISCKKTEEKPAGPTRIFIGIATGGTGGTYFPVGGAIASIISNFADYETPQGKVDIVATAQTSGASVANVNMITNKEIETGFAQNNVVYWAYTGTEAFKDKTPMKNLRVIMSLYPETIQIVALKKSGIKTVLDLKGKKVAVGDKGSGTEIDARTILSLHGITYDDIEEQFMSFSEAADALKDERIDALFTTAGIPTASIVELSTTKEITIVEITNDKINELIQKVPYYSKFIIPKDTYKGMDKDVQTVTCLAQWVCDETLNADVVYHIVKAVLDHKADLEKVHAKGKDISPENAIKGVAIPFHPGAEKYFKELGLIK